jgi:hypothetical protein
VGSSRTRRLEDVECIGSAERRQDFVPSASAHEAAVTVVSGLVGGSRAITVRTTQARTLARQAARSPQTPSGYTISHMSSPAPYPCISLENLNMVVRLFRQLPPLTRRPPPFCALLGSRQTRFLL